MKFRVLSVINKPTTYWAKASQASRWETATGTSRETSLEDRIEQKFTQLIRIAKISTRSSSEICLHHPETKSKVKAFKLRMRKKFIVVNLEVGYCRSLLRKILIDSEQ